VWMRRMFHHRHGAEAVASTHAFLDGHQRLYGQARLDVWIDATLRNSKTDGERALGQSVRNLLAVAADEQILLGELLQEVFAFDFHQEAPESLARARHARLKKSNLALPLRQQKVVIGAELSRLDQIGVVKRRR